MTKATNKPTIRKKVEIAIASALAIAIILVPSGLRQSWGTYALFSGVGCLLMSLSGFRQLHWLVGPGYLYIGLGFVLMPRYENESNWTVLGVLAAAVGISALLMFGGLLMRHRLIPKLTGQIE